MRYLIMKTREQFTQFLKPPCKGAYRLPAYLDLDEVPHYVWAIQINTLEDILKIQESVKHPLILFQSAKDCSSLDFEDVYFKDEPLLEIYDDFRE